jgi:hypothetical protein
VDKTRYIPDLISIPNKIVFCSRPRRFGKSLTVSTLESFYAGRKDLFRGLDVEAFMNSKDFKPRPVIKLDMSAMPLARGFEVFQGQLLLELQNLADSLGVKLRSDDPSGAFRFLLQDVAQKEGTHVVVLIDEYDAPMLNTLSEPALLEDVRKFMRDFYTQLKVAYQHFSFAFITGVCKFSKMGVFSSLNNLRDISLNPKFSSLMGYTHEEFLLYFKPYFSGLASETCIPVAELPEKIKAYYNGFSFDGETRVYNPFSTLSLFDEGVFDNFWMESGSTSFIRNFLKGKDLTVDKFRNIPVERAFLTSPGEIESTSPQGFLYQAGYLTLRKNGSKYTLDYPNREVESAMAAYCIQNAINNDRLASELVYAVREAIEKQDAVDMVNVFNHLFFAVAHEDHRRNRNESFYRATLHTFLLGASVEVRVEEPNNLGRTDIVARYNGKIVVIEMKYAKNAAGAVRKADEAMDQILENRYGNAYANPLLLALAVNGDKPVRAISDYRYIAPGSSEVVEGRVDVKAARRKSGGESEEDARLVPTRMNRLKSLIFSLIFVIKCV